MIAPVLLAPDNLTPASRTPWGGERLATGIKAGLVPKGPIGESWEVSVEPDFPARIDGTAELLAAAIARDPEAWLGAEARRGRTGTAILVKLLDAGDDLSVQIHPADDYAGLAADEGGKPESWYVLERTPGAVLYLGLRNGVDRAQMAEALASGGDVSALLFPVPVEPGDFFRIDAGTPHAIGRGITVVEPQHVLPGRRGLTYRYWDWNRRYDAGGRLSPAGAPRALHVREALEVTAWDAPREEAMLARIRLRAGAPALGGPARIDPLAGPAGLESPYLWVERWSGTGVLAPAARDRLLGVTVVEGTATIPSAGTVLSVGAGRSAAVPAAAPLDEVRLDRACVIACSVA